MKMAKFASVWHTDEKNNNNKKKPETFLAPTVTKNRALE